MPTKAFHPIGIKVVWTEFKMNGKSPEETTFTDLSCMKCCFSLGKVLFQFLLSHLLKHSNLWMIIDIHTSYSDSPIIREKMWLRCSYIDDTIKLMSCPKDVLNLCVNIQMMFKQTTFWQKESAKKFNAKILSITSVLYH